jgi:general secretion pathway protein G
MSILRARGFSLVELMVSVAILGLLASIAMPVVELTQKRHREAQLRTALKDIRVAIDAYKDATQHHRITTADGASGYPPGLEDLVAGVKDLASPNGAALYFIRRIPRDPFCPDATATAIDSWGKRSFESSADAPREGDDVFDVYSKSTEVGMNSVPYREW